MAGAIYVYRKATHEFSGQASHWLRNFVWLKPAQHHQYHHIVLDLWCPDISKCKIAVTPVHWQCSYCSLVLSHRFVKPIYWPGLFFFNLWLNKISANDRRRYICNARRRYICNAFSYCLRPCLATDKNWFTLAQRYHIIFACITCHCSSIHIQQLWRPRSGLHNWPSRLLGF